MMLGKIFITVSGLLVIVLVWFKFANQRLKDFIKVIKEVLADGSVTEEERGRLIAALLNLFGKD